jgi:hypothetical protein
MSGRCGVFGSSTHVVPDEEEPKAAQDGGDAVSGNLIDNGDRTMLWEASRMWIGDDIWLEGYVRSWWKEGCREKARIMGSWWA